MRYIFFYVNYLIENGNIDEAKIITEQLQYINSSLLLSQTKMWLDSNNLKQFKKIFSCNNHNDIISELCIIIFIMLICS